MKKYYTKDELNKKYNSLTKDEKIEVLNEAIDIMGQYNGRSKSECIFIAMGFDNYDGESNTWFK